MKIENPVGITTYVMAFLLAATGLISLSTNISPEIVGGINLLLATLVALIAEVVRKVNTLPRQNEDSGQVGSNLIITIAALVLIIVGILWILGR